MKAIKSLMDEHGISLEDFIVNLAKITGRQKKCVREGINTSMTITVKECTGMGKDVGLRP